MLSPDPSLQDVPQSRQPTLPGLSLQSLVAHRVPLKPYAAPVPRSQSLQDQPTRNLAAFPASHDPDPAAVPTPTATPSARGAVIRQNSDPTSEGPGPSPNPPSWVRPDNEAPPKVSTTLKDKKVELRVGRKKARQPWQPCLQGLASRGRTTAVMIGGKKWPGALSIEGAPLSHMAIFQLHSLDILSNFPNLFVSPWMLKTAFLRLTLELNVCDVCTRLTELVNCSFSPGSSENLVYCHCP